MTIVLLTVDEAAERLRVHPQTVRRLQRDKAIGRQRVGTKVFIREEWIQDYLNENANTEDGETEDVAA